MNNYGFSSREIGWSTNPGGDEVCKRCDISIDLDKIYGLNELDKNLSEMIEFRKRLGKLRI